jgi:hypothetical protein
MTNRKLVLLMLSVPEEDRNKLRMIAAERNLCNPARVTSAAEVAREILCANLMAVETPVRPPGVVGRENK